MHFAFFRLSPEERGTELSEVSSRGRRWPAPSPRPRLSSPLPFRLGSKRRLRKTAHLCLKGALMFFRNPRGTRRPHRKFVPTLECLEGRCLPSVTSIINAGVL